MDVKTYSRERGRAATTLVLLSNQPRAEGAKEDHQPVIVHYHIHELSKS
jgi:hypothetical protein